MTSRRVHEWAWGDVGRRTVCGNLRDLERAQVVSDLGAVPLAIRCGNCERMRGAIGASRVPVADPAEPFGPPIFPTIVGEAELAARAGGLLDREREIMTHATAWGSRWPLHRNHFCASPGSADARAIEGLVRRGLMNVKAEPSELTGGDVEYCVTAQGIAALKRASRAEREQQAQNATTTAKHEPHRRPDV